METWVLVVWMYSNGVAVGSIPGYTSALECHRAAEDMRKQEARMGGPSIKAACIPGPKWEIK